jgi:hypothetical protein
MQLTFTSGVYFHPCQSRAGGPTYLCLCLCPCPCPCPCRCHSACPRDHRALLWAVQHALQMSWPVGVPSVGVPSVGVPSAGVPSAGVPSAGQ